MLTMSPKRRWFVTAGVMTGMLLAALEATVVGTAMPTIVAALGGLAHYSWVFSAYLLTSTVTVPVWGKLSDLFGRRRLFQIGVAVFLVGSAACGFSQTMTQLIVARSVQGLGAGALVPLAMTIIGDIFTLQERAKMQGLFSGVWGLSSIFGPVAGGFITDQLS
jgi:MFS family permease